MKSRTNEPIQVLADARTSLPAGLVKRPNDACRHCHPRPVAIIVITGDVLRFELVAKARILARTTFSPRDYPSRVFRFSFSFSPPPAPPPPSFPSLFSFSALRKFLAERKKLRQFVRPAAVKKETASGAA